MEKVIVYLHGKGGSAEEALHYKRFFADCDVIGFDYQAQTPWEALEEFCPYFASLRNRYKAIGILANSIGAYFALNALGNVPIEKAYLISPIVNMEQLIMNMMQWAGVTEAELKEQGVIETAFGETLSWEYLSWVRNHPIHWNIPTSILYGSFDNLQSVEGLKSFAADSGAELTIMENGEHWFHTEEQMRFLYNWIGR